MFEICKSHRLSSYKNILKTENRRIAVQMSSSSSSSWKWPMTDFEHELDKLWTELSDGKQFLSSRFAHFFFTLKQNHFIVVVIESNIVQLFFCLTLMKFGPLVLRYWHNEKQRWLRAFQKHEPRFRDVKWKP